MKKRNILVALLSVICMASIFGFSVFSAYAGDVPKKYSTTAFRRATLKTVLGIARILLKVLLSALRTALSSPLKTERAKTALTLKYPYPPTT